MPTLRQQKLAQKISDNIRNPSGSFLNMGQLLKEVGYSDSVCKKPHSIINSEGFQDLIDKMMGSLSFQVKLQHLFLINQNSNLSVKAKAIDMYYKLTGKYDAQELNEPTKIIVKSYVVSKENNLKPS